MKAEIAAMKLHPSVLLKN